MEYTLLTRSLFEFLGTFILLLMGNGVCANCSLEKSKAKGAGWVVICFAWGLAVLCGVFVSGSISGAHLNPAVSIGLALAGDFSWAEVLPYSIAQILGAICGAGTVYAVFKDHFDATDDPDTKLGVFCTIPAIPSVFRNLLSEIIGTFVLMLMILSIGHKVNAPAMGLGSLNAFQVTFVIVAIGMSLGGTTGYAINPARDLGPRLAHALLPIRGKGSSQWSYAWIPILGPIIGAALAAGVYCLAFSQL